MLENWRICTSTGIPAAMRVVYYLDLQKVQESRPGGGLAVNPRRQKPGFLLQLTVFLSCLMLVLKQHVQVQRNSAECRLLQESQGKLFLDELIPHAANLLLQAMGVGCLGNSPIFPQSNVACGLFVYRCSSEGRGFRGINHVTLRCPDSVRQPGEKGS
uniref:Uncharacterized protein n=1 Tax=Cacopsylla melanoneura TaxID=428564 RepID=A0A8D8WY75_9HEMI